MTTPFRNRQLAIAAGFLLVLPLVGCQPSLDPDQYGEIIYEVPRVPGADKPYPLPQLEDSTGPEAEK